MLEENKLKSGEKHFKKEETILPPKKDTLTLFTIVVTNSSKTITNTLSCMNIKSSYILAC